MTTLRKNPINSSNFSNFNEPKVVKMYDDTPKENVAKELGTTVEDLKPQHAVTFDRQPQVLPGININDVPVQESAPPPTGTTIGATDDVPEEDPNLTPEQRRAERRAAFKRAADVERRAVQMQKQAQEQLNQMKQFQSFMEQAKKDPTAVAKALGMDPTEFLRQYQNQMFNIPNEPVKPAEESVQERLARYEEERKREKEELQQYKSQQIRNEYIQSRILPVIISDPDKFELLNQNGKEQCASFIYDMMDAHFRTTGEELNPLDVAEEMEAQLTKEFEEKLVATRKVKKFAKHFRTDTDAPGEELNVPGQLGQDGSSIEVRNSVEQNQQLGAPAPNDTSLNAKTFQGPSQRRPVNAAVPQPTTLMGQDAQNNSYQRQASNWNKKQNRIDRIVKTLEAGQLPQPQRSGR
jgi:antitoxin component of RelBE/YafQ-DinJ toxin-antitoxin module